MLLLLSHSLGPGFFLPPFNSNPTYPVTPCPSRRVVHHLKPPPPFSLSLLSLLPLRYLFLFLPPPRFSRLPCSGFRLDKRSSGPSCSTRLSSRHRLLAIFFFNSSHFCSVPPRPSRGLFPRIRPVASKRKPCLALTFSTKRQKVTDEA